MECYDNILCSFTLSLYRHLSRNPNLTDCNLVRKQRENFETVGDFSFPLHLEAWRKHVDNTILRDFLGDVAYNTENILQILSPTVREDIRHKTELTGEDVQTAIQDLTCKSKSWTLQIEKCVLQRNKLYLYLNRAHTFKSVLCCILSKSQSYGRCQPIHQRVQVTSEKAEDPEAVTLSQWRTSLIAGTLRRLLVATGHCLVEAGEEASLHLHCTSHSSDTPFGAVNVPCGVVVGSRGQHKRTVADFVTCQREILFEMARLRSENINSETVSTLANSVVVWELLGVRPSHTVTLATEDSLCTKAAMYVHYNCARLASIHHTFDEMVTSGDYPCRIPFEEVDFSLLDREEEWELVFGYLLAFPDMLQSCVENVTKGRPGPHRLRNFIKDLCYSYSRYYRRVRILTEARPHLLPTMYARLYMSEAIEIVLRIALSLLDISPVTVM